MSVTHGINGSSRCTDVEAWPFEGKEVSISADEETRLRRLSESKEVVVIRIATHPRPGLLWRVLDMVSQQRQRSYELLTTLKARYR